MVCLWFRSLFSHFLQPQLRYAYSPAELKAVAGSHRVSLANQPSMVDIYLPKHLLKGQIPIYRVN